MSFLEWYRNEIAPALMRIDVCIRSGDEIDAWDAAELLDLCADEVLEIMEKNKIHEIDRTNFFSIMEKGSSGICRLYAREVKCKSPLCYTRKELAYIYSLNEKAVEEACCYLRIKEATEFTMPLIFSKIPVSAMVTRLSE